ncbi:MAG: radical SAM protein [Bacteroidetes bacterium GWF2_49_14]|nr:MAG: radical SAM protein [Bacteroidetes bacterium GWF2_49_14]HBB90253.1 radical SAM protein [Bacteroidales bacterium]
MLDRFDRAINYLRISVTDRCNLRCTYCMPAGGIELISHDDILRYDEIIEVILAAVGFGVDKVRITGGEPLVRKGVPDLVRMISGISGIRDLSLTTNGILLEKFAQELKTAGLHRVNISLDTLDPVRYAEITRGGDLNQVLRGIDAALESGLWPVKLNCVIHSTPDEPDARSVSEFGRLKGIAVRFIHEMDLDGGFFKPVIGGEGGNCSSCNRLRLTSNGLIKPCLFSNSGFSIRELGPHKAIELALANKPECGSVNTTGEFYNLGG